MPDPIVINSPGALRRARLALDSVPLDGSMAFQIKSAKVSRSVRQNKLMRRWGRLWAEFYNSTFADSESFVQPISVHASFKLRFVFPKLIEQDDSGIWLWLRGEINKLTTMQAKLEFASQFINSDELATDQFALAMTEWEQWAIKVSKGEFIPPHPKDREDENLLERRAA